MTHKVHPKIYRIEKEGWLAEGFYPKKMAKFLEEDYKIREIIKKKVPLTTISKIKIERRGKDIKITLFSARPGLIIGRRGEGIAHLKQEILKILKDLKRKIEIEVLEIKSPFQDAEFVAQWMAQKLQNRIPYRRVLKRALSQIMNEKKIVGARVQVKGRLDGAEIARKEWLSQGRLPRISKEANIDYGFAEAFTKYGKIGVKVWIYKKEEEE